MNADEAVALRARAETAREGADRLRARVDVLEAELRERGLECLRKADRILEVERERDEARNLLAVHVTGCECGADEACRFARERDAARTECATLRGEVEELEAWQLAVAEGLGYCERPEGQSGYRVAEPSTIIDAFVDMYARAETIEDEANAAQERIAALTGALENLLDEQTGPPLIRRKTQWQAAVDRARTLLAAPAAKGEPAKDPDALAGEFFAAGPKGVRKLKDRPLPPEVLADALHDRIHPTSGRLLATKAVKVKGAEGETCDSCATMPCNAYRHHLAADCEMYQPRTGSRRRKA